MNTTKRSPHTEVEMWLRILHPNGELSPQAARAILQLSFPEADIEHMRELSAKARAGTLSVDEDRIMDEYERVGSVLSILKSRARQVLKRRNRSA
jgi:hypothetical protein